MRFTAHSPNDLFLRGCKNMPTKNYHVPFGNYRWTVSRFPSKQQVEQNGVNVDLRVSIHIPGEEMLQLSCSEGELNAAIDAAADKLQRQLGDISARKSAGRRLTESTDTSEPIGEDDYLTDGEEDVFMKYGCS